MTRFRLTRGTGRETLSDIIATAVYLAAASPMSTKTSKAQNNCRNNSFDAIIDFERDRDLNHSHISLSHTFFGLRREVAFLTNEESEITQ